MKRNGKIDRELVERSLARYGNAPQEEVRSAVERVWQSVQSDAAPALQPRERSSPPDHQTSRSWQPAWIAVSVSIVLVSVAVFRNTGWKSGAAGVIETADSGLQRVVGEKSEDIVAGEPILFGETIHSNGGSGSALVLKDGSHMEMRSKSELVLEPAQDGVRIRLNAGSLIVSATKQRTGHLYVQTKDLTASVVGTVFVVNAESVGSRVAVIQGEVRVDHGTASKKLLPGQQIATNPLMDPQPFSKEVSWSRQSDVHLALLQQAIAPTTAPAKRLAFDAASIKPEPPGGAESPSLSPRCLGVDGPLALRNVVGLIVQQFGVIRETTPPTLAPQGRCLGIRATLADLIALAYGFKDMSAFAPSRSGGPDWVYGLTTFRLEARAENPETATRGQLQEMLQTLLADRFKLKVSWQTREVSGHILSVEKAKSKLQEASSEEPLKEITQNVGASVQRAITGSASIETFLDFLTHRLPLVNSRNPEVLDRTDLKGIYAFNFSYTVPPVAPATGETGRRGGGVPADGGESPAVQSLFEAMKEQLGLRMQSAKIPVDVVVIEHVEMPSEN